MVIKYNFFHRDNLEIFYPQWEMPEVVRIFQHLRAQIDPYLNTQIF